MLKRFLYEMQPKERYRAFMVSKALMSWQSLTLDSAFHGKRAKRNGIGPADRTRLLCGLRPTHPPFNQQHNLKIPYLRDNLGQSVFWSSHVSFWVPFHRVVSNGNYRLEIKTMVLVVVAMVMWKTTTFSSQNGTTVIHRLPLAGGGKPYGSNRLKAHDRPRRGRIDVSLAHRLYFRMSRWGRWSDQS